MDFKLNRIEKFVIKHYKALLYSYFIMVALVTFVTIYLELSDFAFLVNSLFFLLVSLAICVPFHKTKKIAELNDKDFNMYAMLDACNQMIEACNPKDTVRISSFCLMRITGLINIGDFDRAQQELEAFWQYFDLKKVHPLDVAQSHISLANIALEKGDFTLFDNEMRIVYEYGNNSTIAGPLRHTYNHSVKGIQLVAEAYYADKNSNGQDYECRVFKHLNTNPLTGKPLKKIAKPMYYLMAYNKLFLFFRNVGNIEKATHYAQQLVSIGNEQLSDYRRAKEYLENGNSSN